MYQNGYRKNPILYTYGLSVAKKEVKRLENDLTIVIDKNH